MKVSALLGLSASALLLLSVLGDTPAEAFDDSTTTTTTNNNDDDDTNDNVPLADDTERQQELLQKIKELAPQSVFVETFEDEELFDGTRWVKSSHAKYASQEASVDEYTVRTGHFAPDKGLVLDTPARHYGLAVPLDEPFALDGSPNRKELVVQYEVKLQKGLTCGGAYVKLLRASAAHDLTHFSDATPFVLMFGPDKCGSSDKVHLIFQHRNPVTDAYEEKHVSSPPQSKSDRLAHLYTAVVRDDNSFEIFIDQQSVKRGSLLTDFVPPVQPEKEIEDASDHKPSNWIDEPMMRDPNAVKPTDWDEDAPARLPDTEAKKPKGWLDNEPAFIPDPSVAKPDDWDDEDDGEWLAPQIRNPKCDTVAGCGAWERPTVANPAYKGKWRAPMVPNPDYKGEWSPRMIPNPAYFEDAHPARMDPIGALAVEVWTMSDGITFDNFWLGYDLEKAQAFANVTWAPKHEFELAEQEKTRAAERLEADARTANDRGVFGMLEAMVTKATVLASDVATFITTATPLEVGGAAVGVSALAIGSLLLAIMLYVCCGSRDVVDADVTGVTLHNAKKKKDKNSDDDGEENDGSSSGSDSGFDNKPVVATPPAQTTANDSSSSGDEQQKVLRQRKKKAPKAN